jgi:hypothetical protein
MSDAYKAALDLAVAALAASMLDASRRASATEATIAALRVFVGDENATVFPVKAVERVQSDVLVLFGDRFNARLRGKLERRLGSEAAEVVDRYVTEAVAEGIRLPIRPPDREGSQ